MTTQFLLTLMVVGLASGVLTGMLGIGGGLVLVPALMFLLPGVVPDAILMKSCVATSFAVILCTGAWAAWLQQRAGNFCIDMTLRISAGVALGAFVGGTLTAIAPEMFLRCFFVVFAVYVAVQMLTPILPTLDLNFNNRTALVAGAITGVISSLVGVGGATLIVPYLTFCKVDLKKAIGVATGAGVATAFFASIGYLISAKTSRVDMPGFMGYVHIGSLAALVVCCMVGAIGGVELAKKMNVSKIKKLFAFVLIISASKMAWALAT